MGVWAWLILLLAAAGVATAAQYVMFAKDRRPNDSDWIYIAGGALIGGFTGHAWYSDIGPTLDGLHILPALIGLTAGAVLVEVLYRAVLRPRQG